MYIMQIANNLIIRYKNYAYYLAMQQSSIIRWVQMFTRSWSENSQNEMLVTNCFLI